MCQHAETAQTPIERFRGHGPLHAVEPSLPREAFMRRVTQTSSVSLAGNRYFVDQAIAGRRVELRFDPDDLTRMDVYWEGYPAGQAIPFILGRHVHRQVPQAQPPTPVPSTGVDYLGLVLAAHHLVYLANPSIERRLRRHAGRSRTLVLECLPAAIALPRGRIVEVLGPESLAASEPAHRGGAVPQRGLRRAASDPCCPQCTSDLDWAAQRTPLRTGQRAQRIHMPSTRGYPTGIAHIRPGRFPRFYAPSATGSSSDQAGRPASGP
jgi:hypothetical protein